MGHGPTVSKTLDLNDFRGTVERLASGALVPDRFPVAELFNLARTCVCNGYFDGRDRVYAQIAQHPAASPEDKARVVINTADNLRRAAGEQGAQEALSMMSDIRTALGPIAEAERLQVIAQAHLVLYRVYKDGDPEKAARHGANAVEAAKEVLGLAVSAPEIPDDKRIFYHQSYVGIKLAIGQRDSEMREVLTRYLELLAGMPEGPVRAREESLSNATLAAIAISEGRRGEALEHCIASFNAAPGAYYRLDGALGALELLANPEGLPSGATDRIPELIAAVQKAVPELNDAQRGLNRSALQRVQALYPELQNL